MKYVRQILPLVMALVFWLTLFFFVSVPSAAKATDAVTSTNSLVPAETDWERLTDRQYLYLKYPDVAEDVDKIIRCESSWVSDAYNVDFGASGYCQFLAGTWVNTRLRMGLETDVSLRFHPRDAIDTCVFLYRADGVRHWIASQPCHRIYR